MEQRDVVRQFSELFVSDMADGDDKVGSLDGILDGTRPRAGQIEPYTGCRGDLPLNEPSWQGECLPRRRDVVACIPDCYRELRPRRVRGADKQDPTRDEGRKGLGEGR
jgi:hypothetical protein